MIQPVFNIDLNKIKKYQSKQFGQDKNQTPPSLSRGLDADSLEAIEKFAQYEASIKSLNINSSKTQKADVEDVKKYESSFKDLDIYNRKKAVLGLIKDIKAQRVSLDELSDDQVLDIWSWRFYEKFHGIHEHYKSEFMERFDKICEKNTIDLKDDEVLLRTIPLEFEPDDYESFSIGKPDETVGNWPAAAARVKANKDGSIPDNVIRRIKDDKINYLSRNPEANVHDSTLFVIENDGENNKKLHGFDWQKTGVVNREIAGTKTDNGFGSPVFYREVDSKGLSTEVDFSSSTRFKVVEDEPIVIMPVELEDGRCFNVNIVHITPNK